jgi:hypothetical protein
METKEQNTLLEEIEAVENMCNFVASLESLTQSIGIPIDELLVPARRLTYKARLAIGHTIMPICKVISGGQTGADRAALDAAMKAGISTGGYCPCGRKSEDDVIPEQYPLDEIQGGYRQRTRKNVEVADGTVIFYDRMPTGGTALTIEFCLKLKKPFKLIDRDMVESKHAALAIRQFSIEHNVACLNVAGPRESGCPGMYDYVLDSMRKTLMLEA